MRLALVLAWRELRGGARGLGMVVLCLALGVAAMAAVGSLRAGAEAGLAANGRQLLGGDLEIGTGGVPPPSALTAWLAARGARLSQVIDLRTLLVAPNGARQLVALRAVDSRWPLVGAPVLDPPQPLAAALARRDGRYGLLADPLVLRRLRLAPGAVVRLGTESFTLRAALVAAPDQAATPALFGAPALIARAALPGTGLVVPGSIVGYALRAVLPDPADGPAVARALRAAFPDSGWRIRGPADAAPGVQRFVTETTLFMSLVGLTALLAGGIGVANAVRAWLAARAGTIAVLRCLGASAPLVFAVCLIQVAVLAGGGILLGLVAGAALPVLARPWLAGLLPVAPLAGVYPLPLGLAALFGALTAASFALVPLGRAARIPGATLFRAAAIGEGGPAGTWPGGVVLAATACLAVALAWLVVATAADRGLALWFCAAALASLALFRLAAWGLAAGVRALPRPRAVSVRLGLAALYRPGAQTALMLASIGLGLAALAAVSLIEGNVRRQVLQSLPETAPSFFFIDIQDDQLARFAALVAQTPGARGLAMVPMLRARIVAVNGVPAGQVHPRPGTGWALRGDRGLTYAATPPAGTKLVAGRWWAASYDGPPLVSLDARIARGWGVGIGSTIRVNVLGRDIDLRVASLRAVQWQTLRLNFVMVASPGLLAAAPHTNIATVFVPPAAEGRLLRRVNEALPNVTGIAVRGVLEQVAGLLRQIAAAVAATGSVAVLAGGLVLLGAVAAGQRRRIAEAVVLKTLGATRGQLRAAWLVEFGLLGLAGGGIAAAIGTAASFAVLRFVMHAGWAFLPGRLALTLLAALALVLVFGYTGTARALRGRPASWLRNE